MSPVTFIIISLVLLGMLLPVSHVLSILKILFTSVFVKRLHLTGHPQSRTQPHAKSRLILTFCVCVCVCLCVCVCKCVCVCVGERDREREQNLFL
jgi:hypothetical protein